jgi:hypothetical protein
MGFTDSTVVRIAITILALADGTLHLALDFILFRGPFSGPPPARVPRPASPPPGAGGPPRPLVPFPLPLNELFLLNFVGYLVLVVLFWFGPRLLGGRRWLIDGLIVVYVAVTFLGWWEIGRPNPMGLGYLSKALEALLVVAVLVHLRIVASKHERLAPTPV